MGITLRKREPLNLNDLEHFLELRINEKYQSRDEVALFRAKKKSMTSDWNIVGGDKIFVKNHYNKV